MIKIFKLQKNIKCIHGLGTIQWQHVTYMLANFNIFLGYQSNIISYYDVGMSLVREPTRPGPNPSRTETKLKGNPEPRTDQKCVLGLGVGVGFAWVRSGITRAGPRVCFWVRFWSWYRVLSWYRVWSWDRENREIKIFFVYNQNLLLYQLAHI